MIVGRLVYSCCKVFLILPLKMGTTFAILKTSGNVPLKNDLLISSDNGPDKVSLASLRIFVGMLLGP